MLDPKNFSKDSARIIRWIDHYLNNISEHPVKSQVKPGDVYRQIPASAPLASEKMDEIMDDLTEKIVPGMTHWQHPNFHAYFPANSSIESLLAEFVTAAMGAQCMIWDTSPAAAELEQRMMEWLRDALGLPEYLEGVIQDSASSATLVALLTAREVATEFKSMEDGVPGHLRVYCSNETHSSVEKAMGICGMGRKNLVKIPVDDQMRLKPDILEQQILSDIKRGYKPCALVATLGTTGTLAVDPIRQIAPLCKRFGIWLHVDAAYAGTALLLPEYRWMIEGAEQMDSFVFNPHKWMFTNFDCSVYFVKNADLLIRTFEVLPEYLKTKTRGRVNDYRDWGVPLGRRFRALKLWFVMRSFGLKGITEKIQLHISLSNYFTEELQKIPGMELALDPFLNFSCFRYRPDQDKDMEKSNALNEKLLEQINSNGRVFLTHTKIGGIYTLRMLIGQTYVEKKHVDLVLKEIENAVSGIT